MNDKLTNEELSAFIAFGLIADTSPKDLLTNMSLTEVSKLAGELNKYLSPLLDDDADVVSPIVTVLKAAIEKRKDKQ
jgi:hypothetical protein